VFQCLARLGDLFPLFRGQDQVVELVPHVLGSSDGCQLEEFVCFFLVGAEFSDLGLDQLPVGGKRLVLSPCLGIADLDRAVVFIERSKHRVRLDESERIMPREPCRPGIEVHQPQQQPNFLVDYEGQLLDKSPDIIAA